MQKKVVLLIYKLLFPKCQILNLPANIIIIRQDVETRFKENRNIRVDFMELANLYFTEILTNKSFNIRKLQLVKLNGL
jgi:hypothetical protein